MASIKAVFLAFAVALSSVNVWSSAENQGVSNNEVQPRHFLKNKLCSKLGFLCGGGFGGYQGFGGYNQVGYPGGYNQGGYPPINIGISQSQSSSNVGGGGEYPNYYQNNYGYPGQSYNGYPGQSYNGYPGYSRPGYLGNGIGSYNNQFNGNYYAPGGGSPFGGWNGFPRPYGAFYDEAGETGADRED